MNVAVRPRVPAAYDGEGDIVARDLEWKIKTFRRNNHVDSGPKMPIWVKFGYNIPYYYLGVSDTGNAIHLGLDVRTLGSGYSSIR